MQYQMDESHIPVLTAILGQNSGYMRACEMITDRRYNDPQFGSPLRQRVLEMLDGSVTHLDPTHDFAHVRGVIGAAATIWSHEGTGGRADLTTIVLACAGHGLFEYPKGQGSEDSGKRSADIADLLLHYYGYPAGFRDAVGYAIAVHPYSLGVVPDTVEARIVQDADRLQALGMTAIIRCFACTSVPGRYGLFYPADPLYLDKGRRLMGGEYAMDHIFGKTARLEKSLNTETARAMAREIGSGEFIETVVGQLGKEMSWNPMLNGTVRADP